MSKDRIFDVNSERKNVFLISNILLPLGLCSTTCRVLPKDEVEDIYNVKKISYFPKLKNFDVDFFLFSILLYCSLNFIPGLVFCNNI